MINVFGDFADTLANKPKDMFPKNKNKKPSIREFFRPIPWINLKLHGAARTPATLKQTSIVAIYYVWISPWYFLSTYTGKKLMILR